MRSHLFSLHLFAGFFAALLVTGYSFSAYPVHAEPDEITTVSFKAADGLNITADLYMAHEETAPFIILFHQAGWSRGEYREIAPRLNAMGFNCLAVDQRSGGSINSVENETVKNAEAAGKGTTYLDAYADLEAALLYVKSKYDLEKLLVWGSSYSAALVIRLAGDFPGMIDGVLSFAPGEYFEKFGKSATFVESSAKSISCPVFITSAHDEQPNWASIYEAIPSKSKKAFVPETAGNHGSRALWKKFEDSEAYWQAVTEFLEKNFK